MPLLHNTRAHIWSYNIEDSTMAAPQQPRGMVLGAWLEGWFSRTSGRIIWCTCWVLPRVGLVLCWLRCYDRHAHP